MKAGLKLLTVNYLEAHWLHNALARESMNIENVTRMLDLWDKQGGLYDEQRTIVVDKRQVSALRLYIARIGRPDIGGPLEAKCTALFPVP